MTVTCGDCREVMARMPECSVDAVVTDPPYGLEFMGKDWDRFSGALSDRNFKGFTLSQQRTRNVKCPDCDKWAYDHPGRLCECGGIRRAQGSAFQHWCEAWAREALRVLKPGGHLLAMGGTRTYHRLTCALEDAGFEIRDTLMWLHGQGFPKSHDVSKAIDKAAGAARETVGEHPFAARKPNGTWTGEVLGDEPAHGQGPTLTAPATPEAEQWSGFGTALKPAHEPIVLARKPLTTTVAGNVLAHGTGALNVDACRIGGAWENPSAGLGAGREGANADGPAYGNGLGGVVAEPHPAGRWPANVVLSHTPDCRETGTRRVKTGTAVQRNGGGQQPFGGIAAREGRSGLGGGMVRDDAGYAGADGTEEVSAWSCAPGCPVRLLDEQTGPLESGANTVKRASGADRNGNGGGALGAESCPNATPMIFYGDRGGASRFFYCAKASSRERNVGLDDFEAGTRPLGISQWEGQTNGSGERMGPSAPKANIHPTVKPVALMRWLCRLVTPPGGTILDPFCGSGTTGIAAAHEGFEFIGIEQDSSYVAIAEARIAHWTRQLEAAA